MIVSVLYLPKNLAFSSLALNGFHSISVLSITFLRISATPAMWMLSSLPEYKIVSTVGVTCLPKCVHMDSLITRMCNLYDFISLMTCAVFAVSNIVLTFQAPIWSLVFASSMLVFALLASLRLSLVSVVPVHLSLELPW